jgi:hypothetical protein
MLKTFKNEVIEVNPWLPETRKLWGMLLLLSALTFFLYPVPAAQAGEAEILILHTNNVTGYLFPCPT